MPWEYLPLETYPTTEACKVLAYSAEGIDENWVSAFLPEGLSCVVTDRGTLLQISTRTCSKATACRSVFDAEGIDTPDTYAFGDDRNDIPIFAAVGTPIAMDNATDEVKAAAHAVTDSNDSSGVAEGIRRLVLCED